MKSLVSRLFLLLMFLGLTACDQKKEIPTGELFVLTSPSGAKVEANGQLVGLSPIVGEAIPSGTTLLTIQKEGYHTEYVSLQMVTDSKLSREIDLRPLTGLVLIRSNPSGANVTIEDVYKGKTPLALHDLPIGEYRAELQLLGYNDKEIEFEIEDRIPMSRDVDMISNSGTLVVQSNPSGATLFVDGRNEGITPKSIDRIEQGEREITLELPGFRPYRRKVLITPKEVARVDATLTALPGGLSIATLPTGARVYINGELQGESPVNLEEVAPGAYNVRVELRGHAEIERVVRVARGQALVEEFRLERNSGTLQIVTRPAGVRVNIDGEYMGTTKAPPERTDRVSLPLQIDLLSRGSHTLQLVKEGYTFENERFFIEQDKVTTLEKTLERKFIPNVLVRIGAGEDRTLTGVLVRKHINGDVELEIRPGVFRTILARDIIAVEPLKQEETLEE